jgi:hypothetical protein
MYESDRIILRCHPRTPSAAVRAIGARVSRSDGALAVAYTLEGDLARIRVPEPRPPGFADDLWKHTCFEMFVREDGAEAYREFNFSPSGEWAAYAFERYREGMRRCDGVDPRVTLRMSASGLELDAVVPLVAIRPGAVLTIGLAAVIEDTDGALSYWAPAHPAAKPDFHNPDAFAIELGETGVRPRFSRLGSDPGL